MDINLFESNTTQQDRINADEQFAITISMLQSLSFLVALVGGIGLMGTLSISVVERTREIGVMRAIGAKSGIITGMFIMEGVLQGLMSWAISVPLSFIVGYPLSQQLGQTMLGIDLDYTFSFQGVIIWLVTILIISVVASVLPARNATRVSVQESLAYG